MSGKSRIWQELTTGGVVATLWLFPLLNALSSAPVWLHWTIKDSLETAAAWAVASCMVAATLSNGLTRGRKAARDVVTAMWLMTSSLFVCGALVKFDRFSVFLSAHRQSGGWIVVVLGIVLVMFAVALVFHPGPRDTTRLQRIPLAMWPVMFVLAFNLTRAPGLAATQSASRSPAPVPTPAASSEPIAGTANASQGTRTVILLFDELSPDYLYGNRAIDLSTLPALKLLKEGGQIHVAAYLHGGGTLIAIPALFSATSAATRGLVPTLRARGLSVRVWGWYHDYCAAMAVASAQCHANSIYNPRTLHSGFSIVDPWWTNLNLLPAVFPFNRLKNPAAIALHRRTLDATRAWLSTQLNDASADVIYAHVNVPHLPLINASNAAVPPDDPFTMTEAGYLTQFAAVDAVVAQVMRSNIRPTQLIVLSDHNARALLPEVDHEHVVFIRWRAGGAAAQTVSYPEDAVELVARMSLFPGSE